MGGCGRGRGGVGKAGLRAGKGSRMPRPFSLFGSLNVLYCEEDGVKALFATAASLPRQEEQEQRPAASRSMSEGRAGQEKGKEGNLPQKAPRKWLQ